MIEVSHLTKKYGNQSALNDLTFTVEDGKIYGLLGPNGAGKSTCMNIMTGYIAATSGEVKINGYDIVKEAEEAKRQIGYLPEIPPLYQDMKVREYLEFAAELKKVKKEERCLQIEEVMEKTFISDKQGKLIKNLSKGYKQRVGLAQAMLGNPSVIILDEPTVGLDPKQILEIRELIMSLKKEHTIILSSHILTEVSAVCDEIMIISKGKMVACDTPEGLSRRMQGEDELELEIKGTEEDIREVLSEVEGVINFTIRETKEEKDAEETEKGKKAEEINKTNDAKRTEESEEIKAVTVIAEKGCDVRENLFYKLAEKKCPLYKMNLQVKSLEDIFLKLTSGSAETDSESAFSKKTEETEKNLEVALSEKTEKTDSEIVISGKEEE